MSSTYSTSTNNPTEEEKKVLAPLLGKLHVSPASTEEKLFEVYDEVSIAVDDKLISDATGRNALYKIHVSLGKIVNNLTEKGARSRKSSAVMEDKAVAIEDEASEGTVGEKTELMKVEEQDEGTVLGDKAADETRLTRDSLVDDLLSDEDVEMSGI